MNLKSYIDILNISLPLLKDFRFGDCCESIRKEYLALAIIDLFNDIKYTEANKEDISKNPCKYYKVIRSLILKDESLTSEEKLNLISKM